MTAYPARPGGWGLTLALTLLAACTQSPAPTTSGATTATGMFRGGPHHAGVYESPGLEGIGGLQWVHETGGAVRSSPAVADGVVYVGSSDGRLYALHADAGDEIWRFDAGSPIPSTAAVSAELVFFQDRAGVVHALRRRDGSQVWSFTTDPDLPLPWGNEGWDYFISSPALSGDTLVVGAGDGRLYALRASDGAPLWQFSTEGRIRSSPAVADGTVFVGSADGSVYAVDLASGEQRWRYDTEGRELVSADFGFDRRTVQSSPAVVDGTVYVGARDGHLYALDQESGEMRWRFDHEVSWVISSPAVADGIVYAGSSDGLFVQGVDAATGQEVWRTLTALNVFSSPAVVGETVYVGDFTGTMLGLDRSTGGERWRFRTGDAVMSSPVAADGVLYVGSDDGRIYAFRGTTAGVALRRAVFWDPALATRSLYNGHEELRDVLAGGGYEVLDSTGLAAFMTEALASGVPSVVVFAEDYIPANVAPVAADTVLFRRFMEGPGRVVWLGYPPGAVLRDPESGAPTGIDLTRPGALVGVDHEAATLDSYPARATAEGRRWGLPAWWIDREGVDTASVSTVLAADERGRAVAWLERYGGSPGSGFLRMWARRDPIPDPGIVLRVAESGWR